MNKLRTALQRVLRPEDVPSRQEVDRVLRKMSEIARDKAKGEPVVDYDAEYEKLYVADPFFAFFLRWSHAVPHFSRSDSPPPWVRDLRPHRRNR
jgi:hypothetical protein